VRLDNVNYSSSHLSASDLPDIGILLQRLANSEAETPKRNVIGDIRGTNRSEAM
jgi:hypothetical protein